MDNTNNQAQNQQAIDQQQQDQTTTQAGPVSANLQKEQEPVLVSPFIKSADVEPTISPEVSEAGVKSVNQYKPNLPQDIKNAGVALAKETVPAPSTLSQNNFPLTAAQAKIERKSGAENSISWLSALILKILSPNKN